MHRFDRWLKGLALTVGLMVLGGSVLWAEKKQAGRICQGIDIHIMNTKGHQFVQDSMILAYLNKQHQESIVGVSLHQIASKKIENTIKSNNFVRVCNVYKNWNGRLKIAIFPKRPIARIICTDKPGKYIDEQGEVLPLATNYTARVLLINGKNLCDIDQCLKDSEHGLALLRLLNLIDQDPFWNAQINHINCDEKGKFIFTTQLGKQAVVFGRLENINKKLEKLKLFYKVILPHKGWNTYKRVNLEFDNQIVCE
jgi:cell division protein FtsQ